MNLYLVRHGQTNDNVHNIVQGRIDNPLNDTGKKQADLAGQKLRTLNVKFDVLCSSPLKRAIESAKIINKYTEIADFRIVNDLTEREFGILEGGDVSEVRRMIKEPGFTASGFETDEQICQRVFACIEEIRNYGENILIVCHSHTIKAFLSKIDNRYDFEFPLQNTQVVHITYDGNYAVKSI